MIEARLFNAEDGTFFSSFKITGMLEFNTWISQFSEDLLARFTIELVRNGRTVPYHPTTVRHYVSFWGISGSSDNDHR